MLEIKKYFNNDLSLQFQSLFNNDVTFIKNTPSFYVFFFYNSGYSGQFTCAITNFWTHWISCKPSRHIKHHKNNKYTREDSSPVHINITKSAKITKLQASLFMYLSYFGLWVLFSHHETWECRMHDHNPIQLINIPQIKGCRYKN